MCIKSYWEFELLLIKLIILSSKKYWLKGNVLVIGEVESILVDVSMESGKSTV